jgi:glucose/arabinose dehydrogenase
MAIASAKVSKNSSLPLNFQDFFISNSCNSNFNPHETGGKIFADDNVIFFTIGASEVDNIDLLSSFNNDLGSIVSINKLSKEYYVFAKGLRNPQGLSIVDKKVFITSQGPMGGDIFSKVKSGDNFGWPVYSYGFDYNYKDLYKKPFDDEKIAEPTFYFTPSLATSPLVFYTGNEFPRFKNKFILGTLKDKSLLIIDYKFSTNRVVSIERFDIDSRIRDVSYDSKGIIYIITDGGELLKLSRNVTDMKYKNE